MLCQSCKQPLVPACHLICQCFILIFADWGRRCGVILIVKLQPSDNRVLSWLTPSRWWGVYTRQGRITQSGRESTLPATSPGCTQSRTPCPWWTPPNCPYREQTHWKAWTWMPRTLLKTARTAIKSHRREKMKDSEHSNIQQDLRPPTLCGLSSYSKSVCLMGCTRAWSVYTCLTRHLSTDQVTLHLVLN